MSENEDWLERYALNHRNLARPWIYWTSVPMVVVGTVGLLWTLPAPTEFQSISPLLNWGSAFLMVTAVYYFIISLSLAIGLLPFVLAVAFIHMWLPQTDYSPLRVSASLLAAGIIGLWLGHRDERGLSPIFEDLQTVMIGPAWVLSLLYRRVGIPY